MEKKRLKHALISAIAIAIGIWFCILVFRGTDWPSVFKNIQLADPAWLFAEGLLVLFAYLLQAARLVLIFRHTHPISFWHAFSASQIFLFCRQMFPVRGGELIRAFLLMRFTKLPFSRCLGLAIVDRIPEAFVFFVILGITMYAVPGQRVLEIAPEVFQTNETITFSGAVIQRTALGLGIYMALVIGFLLSLYVWKDSLPARISKLVAKTGKRNPETVRTTLKNIAEGMHFVHNSKDMACHFLLVVGTMLCFLSAFVCSFHAFHVEFSWYAPFLALTLIAFAAILPGMPGLVGQFHVAIVLTLIAAAPGMSATEMKAVALVSHAIHLVVLAVPATLCLLLNHVSFSGLNTLDRESVMEKA